ncbi:hypothetical protein BGW80DRAFT_1425321 [Lactifluus volemus]|nr:hypothetical protein BGW80DRAFT_1425321 [Lactifluus volemus]
MDKRYVWLVQRVNVVDFYSVGACSTCTCSCPNNAFGSGLFSVSSSASKSRSITQVMYIT